MDALGLFRKLAAGAKFNYKRFQGDAEKLKIRKEAPTPGFEVKKNPLDFFGDEPDYQHPSNKRKLDQKDTLSKRTKEEERNESDEEVSVSDDDDNDEESSRDNSDEDDEDVKEEEQELNILGAITSKGRDRAADQKRKEKEKKMKKTSPSLLAELKQEKVNHLRRVNHIHVYGTDIPDPLASFEELEAEGLNPRIISNLKDIGFSEPTPIQKQAIPTMMQRREVLACAPTGSGKTAAFVIPILHQLKEPRRRGFRALILAPTRELAKQIYRVFCQLADGTGFRIHFIEKASTAVKKFGPKSSGKFDILVTTPNRLIFMLNQQPPAISLSNVEWLVVDESDKLFEEGKRGFRDQLATIYKCCDGENVRRAMFSATFAYDVEQWCKLNLDNVIQVYIGARNAATDTVKQDLVFVGSECGKLVAMRDIVQKGLSPPVLIFVQSKERAKELFHELIYDGINVEVMHADRTQHQRDNIVKGFRSGKIWVLICTELMGRGIDFKGVALVINYDFPTSAISYIHRIGRTGRAGRPGRAITFFTESDSVNLKSIANVMKSSGCTVPDYMLQMKQASRRVRRDLEKNVPKRETIRTFPLEEIKKARFKRKKIKRIQKGKQLIGKGASKLGNKTLSTESRTSVSHKGKKAVVLRAVTSDQSTLGANAKNLRGKKRTKKQKHQTET